ncbi:MAG: substrate-binding domain-containing protein [Vicinamibacteria bacterium]
MAAEKTVFLLLLGTRDAGDRYQALQEEVALAAGRRLGLRVETAYAAGFDQLRVLKRRASEGLDAAVFEPATVSTLGFVLRELRGRTGLVMLNAWDAAIEEAAPGWGPLPLGTVSTDHARIGRIQGEQARALLPAGGKLLCVTGPTRSSAARERLAGLRAGLGEGYEVLDAEAGDWTEAGGEAAFGDWFRVFSPRGTAVAVIAAQSDELAMGVRRAIQALPPSPKADAVRGALLLGVDACPGYGKELVDAGTLTASVQMPANADVALESLHRFWDRGTPVPLRTLTEPLPYPR